MLLVSEPLLSRSEGAREPAREVARELLPCRDSSRAFLLNMDGGGPTASCDARRALSGGRSEGRCAVSKSFIFWSSRRAWRNALRPTWTLSSLSVEAPSSDGRSRACVDRPRRESSAASVDPLRDGGRLPLDADDMTIFMDLGWLWSRAWRSNSEVWLDFDFRMPNAFVREGGASRVLSDADGVIGDGLSISASTIEPSFSRTRRAPSAR